jgi:glucose-1-phosphate adenylyltransferase
VTVLEERVRAKPPRPVTRTSDPRLTALAVKNTVAMVLAGGRGTRLKQLTDWRAKPSVSFGGKFRIIDFTLSNCINSGIRRVNVCTQYKAHSLIRHIQRGWNFLDTRFDEYIEVLPAQQRIGDDWYQGTADAVYQNLDILHRQDPKLVLVLAGDHVYKMDYRIMIEEHLASGAQVTVACNPMPVEEASAFGVMRVDSHGQVTAFHEKPAVPFTMPGRPDRVLASMGIYLFDAEFLYQQLLIDASDADSCHDFGRNILPRLVRDGVIVHAHDFSTSCVNMIDGEPYWRDVGTVDAYYEANLDLCNVVPELNLYDTAWPIFTTQEQIPPAKFVFDDDERRAGVGGLQSDAGGGSLGIRRDARESAVGGDGVPGEARGTVHDARATRSRAREHGDLHLRRGVPLPAAADRRGGRGLVPRLRQEHPAQAGARRRDRARARFLAELRQHDERRAVLARRRHRGRLIRSEPGPVQRGAGAQPL